MNAKLTLQVDKSVIERAKKYAAETGRSLSEIIENYLNNLTESNAKQKISPKLKKIVGAVKLPDKFDEKKALQYYLKQKHLK